jgi:AcrR family transcriptional regulator
VANRKEILCAARVVFGRMGYGGTRLEDIAAAAGLSRTTVYHYFPSRREIFFELGRIASVAANRVVEAARSIPTTWTREDLNRLITAHLDFLDEHGTLIYTWTQATWDDPELQEVGLAVQVRRLAAIGAELARLRGTSDVDPIQEGIVFLGMAERLWYYTHSGGVRIDAEEIRRTLLIETEGILTRPHRRP